MLSVAVLVSLSLLSSTPVFSSPPFRTWSATFSGDITASGKLISDQLGTYIRGSFALTFRSVFFPYEGYHGDAKVAILRFSGTASDAVIRIEWDFVKLSGGGQKYKLLDGYATITPTDLTGGTFTIASYGSYHIYEITNSLRSPSTFTLLLTVSPTFQITGLETSH